MWCRGLRSTACWFGDFSGATRVGTSDERWLRSRCPRLPIGRSTSISSRAGSIRTNRSSAARCRGSDRVRSARTCSWWRTSSRCGSPERGTPTRSASTSSRRSRCPRSRPSTERCSPASDYVLMGAGIPRAIPRVIDDSAPASRRDALRGQGTTGEAPEVRFDPSVISPVVPPLERPDFLAIVSSHVLATMLARLDSPADGFVIEGPTAGGHNAPPRASRRSPTTASRVYSDVIGPIWKRSRGLGRPFWLAGAYRQHPRPSSRPCRRSRRRPGGHRLRLLRGVGVRPGSKAQVVEPGAGR